MSKSQLSTRLGRIEDLAGMKWGWEENSFTQEKFTEGIKKGEQEFWVAETDNKVVGELHILWNSEDPEEANGMDRAYLCAFRTHKDFQSNGIGKLLMSTVLDRIISRGFKEVTICVEKEADELKTMYKNWGFNTFVKIKDVDIHNFNLDGSLKKFATSGELYLNNLNK